MSISLIYIFPFGIILAALFLAIKVTVEKNRAAKTEMPINNNIDLGSVPPELLFNACIAAIRNQSPHLTRERLELLLQIEANARGNVMENTIYAHFQSPQGFAFLENDESETEPASLAAVSY